MDRQEKENILLESVNNIVQPTIDPCILQCMVKATTGAL